MYVRIAALAAAVLCVSSSSAQDVIVPAGDEALSPVTIEAVMRRSADYELARTAALPRDGGWVRSTLYTGILEAFYTTGDVKYLDAARRWAADEARWSTWGADSRFADNQCCGQVFTEMFRLVHQPVMIERYRAAVDAMLTSPKQGRADWWWCDSLYMAPPGMARLADATGDSRYVSLMNEMFWDATDYLYSKQDHLFYRDRTFFNAKTPNGKPVYWSRGNGWVVGGIVRVLQYLPQTDPYRPRYVALLREMAEALAAAQGPDGLWRSSLADPDHFPMPETSGSGFFCYALAWGVNNGILERSVYLPVVQRAWKGLVACVSSEGRLGYAQPPGAAPGSVKPDGTHEYAVGAFLLAGGEMKRLASFKIDMGSAQLEPGYVPAGPEPWTRERGYGWLEPTDLVLRDRGAPDALRRDYVFGRKPATFRMNVPPGIYRLTLITGDMQFGDHITRVKLNASGVTLPEMHAAAGHYQTVTAAFELKAGPLDINFQSPVDNWIINAISLEPAARVEAAKREDQSFAGAKTDTWPTVSKMPDTIAPYLERFRTQLKAKPVIQLTGLTRADYLKVIAGNVDYFRKLQNSNGAIIDPYRKEEFQYSTPCFALAAATLVGYAGRNDLLEPAAKAMDWSILTLSQGNAATHHEDFFSQPIAHAMPLLKPLVTKARYTEWQNRISEFDPYKVYRSGIGGGNWNVVALTGEWLYHTMGLRPDVRFVESSLSAQGKYFTSPFGLYVEGPMAYDHFPRLWAADMLQHGYNGAHAGDLAEILRRGALTSLFLQGPTGELPAGGRSAHHQWNEAEQICTYEFFAAKAKRDGDLQLAGVYKRAAHLALASMKRWIRPTGEMQIVKNWVAPSKNHGYEGYSSHSQYNLLPMAMLSIAYLHSAETDTVPEQPAPADVGGYVLQIDSVLHKVVANCGGMYVEIDTNADASYEPTGLLRIQKTGFDTTLGPSHTLSGGHHYLPQGPRTNAAIGVAWKNVFGEWKGLSTYTNGALAGVTLLGIDVQPKRTAFQLLYQGYFSGPSFISERYVLTPNSVDLITETPGYSGPLRYIWPVQADDGRTVSKITVRNGVVSVSKNGQTQTYKPVGAASVSVGDTRYPYRNGWARVVTAEYPQGGAITLHIEPTQTGTTR